MTAAQSGLTLIEVLMVVFIIGLLASLVVVNVAGDTGQARRIKAEADIAALETAVERYRLRMRRYPDQAEGLLALIGPPADGSVTAGFPDGGFIRRIPVDPWGNHYGYRSPGEHGPVDIYSYGADGRPGGRDADADIGNW